MNIIMAKEIEDYTLNDAHEELEELVFNVITNEGRYEDKTKLIQSWSWTGNEKECFNFTVSQSICPSCHGKLERGKKNKLNDYKRDWFCTKCNETYTRNNKSLLFR